MPRHIEFSCIFRQGSRIGRAHHPHNEECFEAAGVRDTFISVERRTAVSVLRDKARAGRPWQHKAVMAQGRARRSAPSTARAAAALRRFPGAGRGRSPWRRLLAVPPSAGGGDEAVRGRRARPEAFPGAGGGWGAGGAVRRPRPGSAMPAPTAHLHLCSINCSTRSAHAPPPAGAPG